MEIPSSPLRCNSLQTQGQFLAAIIDSLLQALDTSPTQPVFGRLSNASDSTTGQGFDVQLFQIMVEVGGRFLASDGEPSERDLLFDGSLARWESAEFFWRERGNQAGAQFTHKLAHVLKAFELGRGPAGRGADLSRSRQELSGELEELENVAN